MKLFVPGRICLFSEHSDWAGGYRRINADIERGEFQLTSAIDRLRREGGFLGLLMDGQRFEIGLPENYMETL